ncbi:excinuclease ABC subunit UvrA [Terrimonas sp. NA20]|uniref:UvrABC system protein A n=1 Tax=Terrimonas ginsenosidimutans TaxID=2908004 RepID=A0ABS9KLX9_9BACT|nr:excinuclease ABC subunit UvrA [Terrimonas ginsenosidimutans]MCG2613329.1 excinuclease ABC subunit UvrA [Terrimonas ginsenosidimutans]
MQKKKQHTGFVEVKGAREHNLKNIHLSIPRDAMVVFTGISGSGKSSLAFGTLYAEAQRRYLESVSPYARRLFHQLSVPQVEEITGLPPAVALQQQRGAATNRSTLGSVTTISNLLRMLYSRAGDYPKGQTILYAESFSPNTPEGACPRCHGLGRIYDVTEQSMVPDDSLSIRERAVAAWPTAWHGQNLRDILITLGYDVDTPWRDLPKKDREWILFTEEQPVVPVYAGFSHKEVKQAIKLKVAPSYKGTFTSARKHVLQTFANSQSAMLKKRAQQYMVASDCPVCNGRRLKKEALSITFQGYDIAEISSLPLEELHELLVAALGQPFQDEQQHQVVLRIGEDMVARLNVLLRLGLGYLSLDRSTPTLSPGELQRMRLATQVRANLFGVVYVLDEPSAGLHPSDTEALLETLDMLKAAGNSLFIVEHDLAVIRHADWIVDVGPFAGQLGGEILYSGKLDGLQKVEASLTKNYLQERSPVDSHQRLPKGWLRVKDITRNNLDRLAVDFPLGIFTAVTGISGSGKSSLVSQALVELVSAALGQELVSEKEESGAEWEEKPVRTESGVITAGMEKITRLIQVDQKAIGRTPRSNLATYTGLFDHVRKIFAATRLAKQRKYDAGYFSFNLPKGRCPNCQGEGFVMVELLFLPSVYTPCPVCHGSRYTGKTLEVTYLEKNIAQVLDMTVNEAAQFFKQEETVSRSLNVLIEVGLGYLRLGQPATELSGGEAQRIKLATELQRVGKGNTLYVLDEPTTGLHPFDVEKLMKQLHKLVDAGNTVIVVEHNMRVIAGADWVMEIGPGAGAKGGQLVVAGTPEQVSAHPESRTAPYLQKFVIH